MRYHLNLVFLKVVLVFLFFFCLAGKEASAGLMVNPTRLEFNDKEKIKEIKLINKSDQTVTYRIILQHLRMKPNGSYEVIEPGEEKGEQFADQILRFSPKRTTLKPGQTQIIRVAAKRPSDLEDGEYRSHMLFTEEAPADLGNNIEQIQTTEKGKISVFLKPLFGISIPVIVKQGDLKVAANITHIALKENKQGEKIAQVKLSRMGSSSIYGSIAITFTPKGSNKEYNLGTLDNVSIFYPYESREAVINLTPPSALKLKGGTLTATYYIKSDDDSNSKIKVIAEKLINI